MSSKPKKKFSDRIKKVTKKIDKNIEQKLANLGNFIDYEIDPSSFEYYNLTLDKNKLHINKDEVKHNSCKYFINCKNIRILRNILYYLLKNNNQGDINLSEYKIDVIYDNIFKLYIATFNTTTQKVSLVVDDISYRKYIKSKIKKEKGIEYKTKKYVKDGENPQLSEICIISNRKYKECLKYLDKDPIFFTDDNQKRLYTLSSYNDDKLNKKEIDTGICRVLITCDNATALAEQLKVQLKQEESKKEFTLSPLIKIKIYSKFLISKLEILKLRIARKYKRKVFAEIKRVNLEDLSFTVKISDSDSDSYIDNLIPDDKKKFYFYSLCVTNDTYNKYAKCNESEMKEAVEKEKEKEKEIDG